ncbi:MAG: single-stranded DNA-binding protein [Lachnospiraceae bacterium]|nr:single-stranded DNA-binding protein [Lachnospiraceae bacterium]MEE3460366.1 single-stranded DNA-binding protein [Lachnospiraceae bacterium]
MNKVILMGRLTRDPEVKYSSGNDGSQRAYARYSLAVDRRFKKPGDQQTADFINCVVFGKGAEFAEKYFHKGIKIAVTGRLQTGSYTNKDGQKVFTTDVVVDEQEFAESKSASQGYNASAMPVPDDAQAGTAGDGFMNVPGADVVEEDIPFGA